MPSCCARHPASARPHAADVSAGAPPTPGAGEALLATWHELLDAGRSRTATSTWPAPPSRPRPDQAGDRRRAGVRRRRSRSAPSRGRSPCRVEIAACRTGWCGCRPTPADCGAGDCRRRARPVGASAVGRGRWLGWRSRRPDSPVHAVVRRAKHERIWPRAAERARLRRPAVLVPASRSSGVFAFLVVMTLFSIVFERKVVGRMQNRIGPNRVGPWGMLQSLADGMKLAFKEEIIPVLADKPVYFLAPVLSACRRSSRSPSSRSAEVSMFGAPHAAAADRPAGRRARGLRLLVAGRVRHRAVRLGVRLDLPAARRPAQGRRR